jgi:hypothetical protein
VLIRPAMKPACFQDFRSRGDWSRTGDRPAPSLRDRGAVDPPGPWLLGFRPAGSRRLALTLDPKLDPNLCSYQGMVGASQSDAVSRMFGLGRSAGLAAALARWPVPLLALPTAALAWSRGSCGAGAHSEPPYTPPPIGSSTCLIPPDPAITV